MITQTRKEYYLFINNFYFYYSRVMIFYTLANAGNALIEKKRNTIP